jgi:hypothetical protein
MREYLGKRVSGRGEGRREGGEGGREGGREREEGGREGGKIKSLPTESTGFRKQTEIILNGRDQSILETNPIKDWTRFPSRSITPLRPNRTTYLLKMNPGKKNQYLASLPFSSDPVKSSSLDSSTGQTNILISVEQVVILQAIRTGDHNSPKRKNEKRQRVEEGGRRRGDEIDGGARGGRDRRDRRRGDEIDRGAGGTVAK